jgi:hypothetical protein
MLDEVRKAAFLLHKSKSKTENVDNEEEDEEHDGSTLPVVREEWEMWYPQEWIGWCMYGLPSDKPTEYWVHQPVSDGPTDVESYYTDPKGNRKIKKPHGRTTQRANSDMVGTATKTTVDHNTLMAHHLLQVDNEMNFTKNERNMKMVTILMNTAVTDEDKEFSQWCYSKQMQIEKDTLRKHYNDYEKNRDAMFRTDTSVVSTANFVATPVNEDKDIEESQEDETNYEYTPMENMYDALEASSYIREFHPPASYSGQFSPSEPNSDIDVRSEKFSTARTEVYEGDSVSSQMTEDSMHNKSTTASNSSGLMRSLSSFTVEPNINRRLSGQARPPLPPKKETPTFVLKNSHQYVTRSSPASSKPSFVLSNVNPFTGMSWEDMNGKLHSTYPIIPNQPGVICIDAFDVKAAVQDIIYLSQLKKNEVDEDPDLYLVGLWIKKIRDAIRSAKQKNETRIEDSDSEDA